MISLARIDYDDYLEPQAHMSARAPLKIFPTNKIKTYSLHRHVFVYIVMPTVLCDGLQRHERHFSLRESNYDLPGLIYTRLFLFVLRMSDGRAQYHTTGYALVWAWGTPH